MNAIAVLTTSSVYCAELRISFETVRKYGTEIEFLLTGYYIRILVKGKMAD